MTVEDDDVIRIKDWNLTDRGLVALPESFGSITVSGDLNLYYNQLVSLPESFGSITDCQWLTMSCIGSTSSLALKFTFERDAICRKVPTTALIHTVGRVTS